MHHRNLRAAGSQSCCILLPSDLVRYRDTMLKFKGWKSVPPTGADQAKTRLISREKFANNFRRQGLRYLHANGPCQTPCCSSKARVTWHSGAYLENSQCVVRNSGTSFARRNPVPNCVKPRRNRRPSSCFLKVGAKCCEKAAAPV